MSITTRSEMVSILDRAAQELQTLLSDSEIEIGTVASGFEQLAQHTDAMVQLAVAVVGCLEDGSVSQSAEAWHRGPGVYS
jgi:hypothetical protein